MLTPKEVTFVVPSSTHKGGKSSTHKGGKSSTHKGGKGGSKRMKKMKKMKTPTCYKRKDVPSSTGEQIYAFRPCPSCAQKTLKETPKGTKGVDYVCTTCDHKVELKQGEAIMLNLATVCAVRAGTYTLPADTYVAHHQADTGRELVDQEYRWSKAVVVATIHRLPPDETQWPLTTEEKPRVILGLDQLGVPVVVGTKKSQADLAVQHGFKFKVHDLGTRGNSIWRLNQTDLREVITKKRQERLATKRREDAMIGAIYLANSCTRHTHCDVGCADCNFVEAWKQIRTIQRKTEIRSAKIARTKRAELRLDGLTYDVLKTLAKMSL